LPPQLKDDRQRVIADFGAECARLGKANVMRFGWPPAADDTGLRGDELTVLLVAQSNVLCGDTTATRARIGPVDGGRDNYQLSQTDLQQWRPLFAL